MDQANQAPFLNLLDHYITPFIVISGVVLLVLLIANYISLSSHYNQINAILNWKNKKTSVSKKTLEVEESMESTKATPEDIIALETSFNKTCSWHEALSQLIPLYPLFGILGTVAGLILQLNAQAGDTIMFESLDIALKSTLYGLIFAIILKFVDALFPARKINETEIVLGDHDKKFNTAVIQGNITD